MIEDHWCACCGSDDRDPGCCQNLTEEENRARVAGWVKEAVARRREVDE